MSSTGGIVTNHPLVVLLVHGVGRPDVPAMEKFEQRIKAATKLRLPSGQQSLVDRLQFCTPNWGAQFDDERGEWLRGLFPESTLEGSKWSRIRSLARLAAWATGVMLLVTAFHALIFGAYFIVALKVAIEVAVTLLLFCGVLWIFPQPLMGWAVGVPLAIITVYEYLVPAQLAFAWLILAAVIAGVLIALGALWLFPWGDTYSLARTFEAFNVADVVLYGSDAPQERIWEKVVDSLDDCLGHEYVIKKGDQGKYLPAIFIGHSLGSVIAYDLLLGIAAMTKNPSKPAATRELTRMRRANNAVPEEEQARFTARKRVLEKIVRVQNVVRPLGMVTMGSPISLFLFRKPALAKRRNLWSEALPGIFDLTGIFATPTNHEMRWRWQNFWHPADFVAHRIGPFFNTGYQGGTFVTDTRITPMVRSAIHAHGSYQTHPRVMNRIAEHLAHVLMTLPP